MAYPEQQDVFVEKLNKKQDGGVYVIDEQVQLADGAYEGLLAHDNAINSTVKVFTGPKLTGQEIIAWTLSTPAETPWRRRIRIFAEAAVVFVSYETPGDQVEADDVNALQEALMATQAELDRYKTVGLVDGGLFNEGE
ncbi:phosphoglucomutase [Paenibacillus mesotrionivorans]|uniref:Phosphoglucomutase n=1 Tax=Paenibacillus mesotrionivorans TaxID=3160968 RepID=A0ACC7NYT4_9BACL